jgi:hypothetical protein
MNSNLMKAERGNVVKPAAQGGRLVRLCWDSAPRPCVLLHVCRLTIHIGFCIRFSGLGRLIKNWRNVADSRCKPPLYSYSKIYFPGRHLSLARTQAGRTRAGVVSCTTLSVSLSVQYRMVRSLIDELWILLYPEGTGRRGQIEVPSRHLPEGSEESHEDSLRIADIPTEIWNERLQKPNLERYRYTTHWGFLFLILGERCDQFSTCKCVPSRSTPHVPHYCHVYEWL